MRCESRPLFPFLFSSRPTRAFVCCFASRGLQLTNSKHRSRDRNVSLLANSAVAPRTAPLVGPAGWRWPTTDTQHWIHPLNRFDECLETGIRNYELGSTEHLQTNAFTPRTRELVLSVLNLLSWRTRQDV